MTDSNPLDLDNLRAYARAALERAEKASPGPWRHVRQRKGGFGCEHVVSNDKSFETGCMNFWPTDDSRPFPNDPEFIAAARLDVPNLAASVLTLCAENERLRAENSAHVQDTQQPTVAARGRRALGGVARLAEALDPLQTMPGNES